MSRVDCHWAVYVRYTTSAVTCPWEVWEKLPDGTKRYLAAYQTSKEAIAAAGGKA